MAEKNITIRCRVYGCYWNLGMVYEQEPSGNCSSKRVCIELDDS